MLQANEKPAASTTLPVLDTIPLDPKTQAAFDELVKCFNSKSTLLDLHALSNAFDKIGINGFAQIESPCIGLVVTYIIEQSNAINALLAAIKSQAQRGERDWDIGLKLLQWCIQASVKIQLPENSRVWNQLRIPDKKYYFEHLIIPGTLSLLEVLLPAATEKATNNELELIPKVVFSPAAIAAKWQAFTRHTTWTEIQITICEDDAVKNTTEPEQRYHLASIFHRLAEQTHVAEAETRFMMANICLEQAVAPGRPDQARRLYDQAILYYIYSGRVANSHFRTLLEQALIKGLDNSSARKKEQAAAEADAADMLMQAVSGTSDAVISSQDDVQQNLTQLLRLYTDYGQRPSEQLLQAITNLIDTKLAIHCRAMSMCGRTIYTNEPAKISAIQTVIKTILEQIQANAEQSFDRLMLNAYLALRVCNNYSLAIINYLRLSLHPHMQALPAVPIHAQHFRMMHNVASGNAYQFLIPFKNSVLPVCLSFMAAYLTQPGNDIGRRDIAPIERFFPATAFTMQTNPLLKNGDNYPYFLAILLHAYPQLLADHFVFLTKTHDAPLWMKFYRALEDYFQTISHESDTFSDYLHVKRPRALEYLYPELTKRYKEETNFNSMISAIENDMGMIIRAGCPYSAAVFIIYILTNFHLGDSYACMPQQLSLQTRQQLFNELSITLWNYYFTAVMQIFNGNHSDYAYLIRQETLGLLTAEEYVNANPDQQATMLSLGEGLLKFKAPAGMSDDNYNILSREYGFMLLARHYSQDVPTTTVHLKLGLQKILEYKHATRCAVAAWSVHDNFMVTILASFILRVKDAAQKVHHDFDALVTDLADEQDLEAAMLLISCLNQWLQQELKTTAGKEKSWWSSGSEDKQLSKVREVFFSCYLPAVVLLMNNINNSPNPRQILQQYLQYTNHDVVFQQLGTVSLTVFEHEQFFKLQDSLLNLMTTYNVDEPVKNMIWTRRAQVYLALITTVKDPQRLVRVICEFIRMYHQLPSEDRTVRDHTISNLLKTLIQSRLSSPNATAELSAPSSVAEQMLQTLQLFFQNQPKAAELMMQALVACATQLDLWDTTMQVTMQIFQWLRSSEPDKHGKYDRSALMAQVCYPALLLLFRFLCERSLQPAEKIQRVQGYLFDGDTQAVNPLRIIGELNIAPELPIAVEEICLQILLQLNTYGIIYKSNILNLLAEHYLNQGMRTKEPLPIQEAISKTILMLLHMPTSYFSSMQARVIAVLDRTGWPKDSRFTKENITMIFKLLEFVQHQMQETNIGSAAAFIADLKEMNQFLAERYNHETVESITNKIQQFSYKWLHTICGYQLTSNFLFLTSTEELAEIKSNLITLSQTISRINYTPPKKAERPHLSPPTDAEDSFLFTADITPKAKPKVTPLLPPQQNSALAVIANEPEQGPLQLLLVKSFAHLFLLLQHQDAIISCVQYRAFGGEPNKISLYLESLLKYNFNLQDPEYKQLLGYLATIEKHGLPKPEILGAIEQAALQFTALLESEYSKQKSKIAQCSTNEEVQQLWGDYLRLKLPLVQGYPLIGYLNMMFNPFSIDYGFTFAMKANLQAIWDGLKRYEVPSTELLPQSRPSFNWQSAVSFVGSWTNPKPSPTKTAAPANSLASPSAPFVERVAVKPAASPPTSSSNVADILPTNPGHWLSTLWTANPAPAPREAKPSAQPKAKPGTGNSP